MRLLRLYTTDENIVFQNNFNSNIVIEPYSKIALQNVSFEIQGKELVIDSNNDQLEYQYTTAGGTRNVSLTHGTYDKTNIATLLADIQRKLNINLFHQYGKENGIEWKAELNNKNKVQLEYKQGKNVNSASYVKTNVNLTTPPGAGANNASYFSSNAVAGTNLYSRFIYNTNFIARGCGIFNMRIQKLIDNTQAQDTNGFIFGLTTENIDNVAGKAITDDIMKLAIVVTRPTDNFQVIADGVNSPIAPFTPQKVDYAPAPIDDAATNDNVQIRIEDGKLKAVVLYDNLGVQNTNILYEMDYNNTQQLYPFVIFRGGINDCQLSKALFLQSPYNTTLHADVELVDEAPYTVSPTKQSTLQTEQYFSFEGSTLQKYLGYNQIRYPLSGTLKIKELTLIAEHDFSRFDVNELYIVEMLNLKLLSYDGYGEERRNILATIPKKEDNSIVNYEPNTLTFIDIDNAEPIILRNVNAIIRNNDLSMVEGKGLASMTILLKSKDE